MAIHVLELRLRTTAYDEVQLEKRFLAAWRCHNTMVTQALRCLHKLKHDRTYAVLLNTYRETKQQASDVKKTYGKESSAYQTCEAAHKQAGKALRDRQDELGLSKTAFETYLKVWQHHNSHLLSSQMVQVIAGNVWTGTAKVLAGSAKQIHYKRKEETASIRGKSPSNGIRYYDADHADAYPENLKPVFPHEVEFLGLQIRVSADWEDPYVSESLAHKVKYCILVRRAFDSGYRYYVQLVLDGPAPQKIQNPGTETMGIDPGISSAAAVSDNACVMEELAPHAEAYDKEIRRLQAAIDREMRLSNPGNYTPDGKIRKRRKGGPKLTWTFSKRCMRKKRRVKVLHRKKAAATRCGHNALANRLIRISGSGLILVEKMNYPALAKRAKKTQRTAQVSEVRQKDGTVKQVCKYLKKKRWGSSVGRRAPAGFLAALKKKASQYNGIYSEIDTKSVKASRYQHDTDTYVEIPLSRRDKMIGGHKVQRDLYSAFLIAHVSSDLKHVDRASCIRDFPDFCNRQDACIAEMKEAGISMKQCFGF